MKDLAIGIDIGGTNTVLGLVNRAGEVSNEASFHTRDYLDFEDYCERLAVEIEKLSKNNKDDVQGIGIGAPNGNFFNGTIEYAPNLPWKGILPLQKIIEEKTGLKCLLTNDANAGAVGEKVFGGAKNMKDFIFITLGTGVGSGIFCNDQLVYGHDGFAGELGHVIIKKNGRKCTCGRKGCLETYTSARGLVLTTLKLAKKEKNNPMAKEIMDFENLTPKDVFQLANSGNSIAQKTFDKTARYLGESLANAVAFSSPKAIFIFGGLANAKELLLEPTKKHMENYMLKIFQNKVSILPSKLPGAYAAVLGAAAIIFNS